MAHSPEGGHHGKQTPLGASDAIIGAVLFVLLVFGLRAVLDAMVPGLLKPETMVHIIISGLMFVVVWATLGSYLFQPYLDLIEEREERTRGDEERALHRRREVSDLQAQIDEALRLARLEGIKLRDAKVGEAKRSVQGILDAAQATAESDISRAQQKIAQLKQEAEGEVATESAKLAEQLVRKTLNSDAQHTVH
jgi:F0F1-type ATP synthase membrane subunit b/b'